jgi:anti-sigma factor RsiW
VTCDEIRGLLSPYADGELDLVHGLEIERHLEACAACAAALEQTRSLSAALADPALYYRAPVDLHRGVRAAVPGAGGLRPRRPWRPVAAAVAAAALLVVTLGVVFSPLASRPREDFLTRQVVDAHVRSLQAEHLIDKRSSNQHVVKPWFQGKVDVGPVVKDLAEQDFPLEGGRLDYLDGHDVAALVYRRNQHFINVFVWRSDARDHEPEYLARQGYQMIRWTDNGRTIWVVSDLNAEELREFAELLRR